MVYKQRRDSGSNDLPESSHLLPANERFVMGEPPTIWNPTVAINLSLFLTPIFGTYIHYLNWKKLGKPSETQTAKTLFNLSILELLLEIYLAFFMISSDILSSDSAVFFTGDKRSQSLALGVRIIFLIVWYYWHGKTQVNYVNTITPDYNKRGWLKPLTMAICCLILINAAIFASSFAYFSYAYKEQPIPVNTATSIDDSKTLPGEVPANMLEAAQFIKKYTETSLTAAFINLSVEQTEIFKAYAKFHYIALVISENNGFINRVKIPVEHVVYINDAAKYYYELGIAKSNSAKMPLKPADFNDAYYHEIFNEVYLLHLQDIGFTGNATAQLHLGFSVQDDIEAVAWFQKSADGGNLLALSVLADRYKTGKGVKQDLQKAAALYHEAAEQGNEWDHVFPQWDLARLYYSGDGVPKDYVLAYMWYNIAATAGLPMAATSRDNLESEMTSAPIEKAKRLSREFMAKHAKQK